MQIKRFEAKTMTAALRMVKEEFGPDAVILSARSLRRGRGLFAAGRTAAVEVTAAKDTGWAAYTAAGLPEAMRSQPEVGNEPAAPSGGHGLLRSLNRGLRSLAGRRPASAAEVPGVHGCAGLVELHHHLLAQEVERELAADIIEQIKRQPGYDPLLGPRRLQAHLSAIFQDMGRRPAVEGDPNGAPRVLLLVGPSGAGKTTTAIKLAARQSSRRGRRVALLTLDDMRIGAIEQIRIYARILGIRMAAAGTAAEVRQAMDDFQAEDCVIVDTPGISPGEEARRAEICGMVAPLLPRQTHLVLNACSRERDLVRMIDGWKGVAISGLAFTHLDEAGACGSLLNLARRTQLPLSFVGTGPRIPEDLQEAPAALLAGRMLPVPEAEAAGTGHAGGARAETTGELPADSSGRRVANRNSDLYHRPDCRWAHRIKHENLLRFASAQDAEARRFMPCRDCRPEEDDGGARPMDDRPISGCRGRM
jgi:flagellar biosynthesis protein FlhF